MPEQNPIHIRQHERYWRCTFTAMASPCELLFTRDTGDERQIQLLATIAYQEAKRIEQKFSRYRDDNIVFQINHSNGNSIQVDAETARMLDYSAQLHQLSEGLFDITSGVLRKAWRFDGSDNIPDQDSINKILPLVGWQKVEWKNPYITLPADMEIDFGGIGKEYAVDRSVQLLRAQTSKNFVVNYGGDLFATGPQSDGSGWLVGLDDPAHTGIHSLATLELKRGAVATSGDARRFLIRNDIRYSHILDPRSGWPVTEAPHGITVVAATCTEAGMLATFAMLQGANAKQFLQQQEVEFWVY